MSLDKHANDTASLDPRLRMASDRPECFICGTRIRRTTSDPVTVDTGASIGLHAHAACCDNRPALDILTRYWKALRAAMSGTIETPNPARALIRGEFQ